jgi:hypothetical protein
MRSLSFAGMPEKIGKNIAFIHEIGEVLITGIFGSIACIGVSTIERSFRVFLPAGINLTLVVAKAFFRVL